MAKPNLPVELPNDLSLRVRNLKCFADSPEGFAAIKRVNVIVGRNNTGKTTLLDLVNYAVKPSSLIERGHRQQPPRVLLSWPLTEAFIDESMPNQQMQVSQDSASWSLSPRNWLRKHLLNKDVTWELHENNAISFVSFADDPQNANDQRYAAERKQIAIGMGSRVTNPFTGFEIRRLTAERDIIPEASTGSNTLQPNGEGMTNIVERYLNNERLNRRLIEEVLLDALNLILRPDANYSRLLVRQKDSGKWEINLDEPHKGLVPMSQTGSGLKTVLLVLANLLLVPIIKDATNLANYIFCFEELENHLHPAIQRRLFRYLRKKAVDEKCRMFITTHSNVVIDLFSNDEAAQLLHVTHNGQHATVSEVKTHAHGCSVLDDLDVRASDLLQTTAVVWVEGPSDRTYFNRWIELWSKGELQEGVHYQCLPYGGSVGTHFSFDSPDVANELIAALRINRHAILLADSDKREETDELKENLVRLRDEVENTGGIAWVTKGKEVENYIPAAVFRKMFKNENLDGPGQYTDALKYAAEKKGNKTPPRKTELAHNVANLLKLEMLPTTYDLAEQLEKVCQLIRKWNRLEPSSQ